MDSSKAPLASQALRFNEVRDHARNGEIADRCSAIANFFSGGSPASWTPNDNDVRRRGTTLDK